MLSTFAEHSEGSSRSIGNKRELPEKASQYISGREKGSLGRDISLFC